MTPSAILVRHARTAWTGVRYCGRSDPPLDERGRASLSAIADEIAALVVPGTRIVTSPLLRARETAAAIGASVGGPIEVDERWHETDFGAAEGLTWDELQALEPALAARLLTDDIRVDWPRGERAPELDARVRAAWLALLERGASVVVVTHGGPIRTIMAAHGDGGGGARCQLEPGRWVALDLRPLAR